MAELIIILDSDPVDGSMLIRVDYRSDADALPQEHEIHHRQLVRSLVPGLEGWQRERPGREAAVG